MAQDNTLGAPTEGLGQTVTFGLGSMGGVPQLQADPRQRLQLTSQGQATTSSQALQVPEAKQNATFETLVRLGGEILKPQMKQAQDEAFMRGFRKAQSGEAVKEIVDEQPWYSQLLGDIPVADGARAYTASAKAATLAAEIEEDMPELRKLEGPDLDRYMANAVKNAATGDNVTDTLFQQQVAKMVPPTIKSWAKANIRYKQELVEQGVTADLHGKLRLLGASDRAAREGGTKEQADTLEAALPLLDAFVNPGMDAKLHDRLVADAVVGAVSSGNFVAYDVLKQSGKLAQLNPEAAFHVNRAYRQAAAEAKTKLPMDFVMQVAEFESLSTDPASSEEAILAAAQKINQQYTRVTGDSGSYLGPANTVREIVQFRDAERRRLDAARREIATTQGKAAKAAAEEAWLTDTAAAVTNPAAPYTMAHLKPAEQQAVFDRVRTASPEKALLAAALQWEHKVYDKALQDRIQSGIEGSLRTSDPTQLYTVYQQAVLPLIKAGGDMGEAVAATYAGRASETIAKYHSLVRGRNLSPVEQQAVYMAAIEPDKEVKDQKFVDSIAKELTTGTVMGIIKATGMVDDVAIIDPAGLARRLAPGVTRHMPLDQAVAKAQKDNPNLTVLGGHYWTRSAASTDVKQWVQQNREVGGVAPDTQGRAMQHAINSFAAEVNIDSGLRVQQIQDTPDAVPQFVVMGVAADGITPRFNTFTVRDMNARWLEKNAPGAPTKLEFGPKLTFLPKEGAKSIYD
jgi:hypothetical protein